MNLQSQSNRESWDWQINFDEEVETNMLKMLDAMFMPMKVPAGMLWMTLVYFMGRHHLP